MSFLGGVLGNFLLGMAKWLIGCFAIFRAGEAHQAEKDTAKTLDIVAKERDASDRAGSAIDAARDGRF